MRWYQRFFRRDAAERRLDAELRFHWEQRAADLAAAGMAPEEARRQAGIELGGIEQVKEECRDVGAARIVDTLLQDLRYGLRQLRRNRGFAAVAILTLALGIGATTAIFSVVNAVLLRPLPYSKPSRLVVLWEKNPNGGLNIFSTPAYLAWRRQSVVKLAGISTEQFNLRARSGADHVTGGAVSADFFPNLGAKPMLGRTFFPQEDRPGGRPVAVLGYALWRRDFAGSPDVLGHVVDLNGAPFDVVGVMPQGFRDPVARRQQIWVPLEGDRAFRTLRSAAAVHWLLVVGRLRAGTSLGHAKSAMTVIQRRLSANLPRADRGLGVAMTPLADTVVGSGARAALWILVAAVALVLLIGCANVASLFLGRATARAREMALRSAIGAERSRLFRQLITESALVSVCGGAAGVALALWGLDLMKGLGYGGVPRADGITIDGRVLIFALAASVLTTLLSGVAPAAWASQRGPNAMLRSGGASPSGRRAQQARRAVTVTEIALAAMLLVGAALTMRSFWALLHAPLGFNPQHILTMQMAFSPVPDSPYAAPRFYARVLEGVRGLPGVQSAAIARDLPLTGADPSVPFRIFGRKAQPGDAPVLRYRAVSSDYFRTLGIPMLEGRDFSGRDGFGTRGVAVINQVMAQRYWPNRDPIGARIRPVEGAPGWCNVIGVVGNVRKYGPGVPVEPTAYFSYLRVPAKDIRLVEGRMSLVVRSASALRLAAAIRSHVKALGNGVPVYRVRSMEAIVSNSRARPRFSMALLAAFAAVALVLAAAGVYGVFSYSVAVRTREIGIRMALGAGTREVRRAILRQAGRLALIGVAVGAVGAFALTRFLASLLYGVSADDPVAFAAAALILVTAALLASYLPARRAAKVDPMVALRCE